MTKAESKALKEKLFSTKKNGYDLLKAEEYTAMKRGGLLHRAPRHPSSLTKADLAAQRAENLIHRDFTADAPNRKWLTDITQIQCLDGKLYMAAVLDCYNGEIVGLAMGSEFTAIISLLI